jgi:hypothetical protein
MQSTRRRAKFISSAAIGLAFGLGPEVALGVVIGDAGNLVLLEHGAPSLPVLSVRYDLIRSASWNREPAVSHQADKATVIWPTPSVPTNRPGSAGRFTDAEWSHGTGPEVSGPILALVMAMTGRKAALDDLSGEGVSTLRSRA